MSNRSRRSGMSLVELLVALGISSIVMMTIMSLINSLMKENRNMSDKVESVDLERQLGLLMSDDNLCGCQLSYGGTMKPEKSPTSGGASAAVELSKLTSSCDPTTVFATKGQKMAAISASFTVSRLAVRDLRPTGRKNPVSGALDEYTGAFYIEFDSSQNPSRALRPIKASKIFTTDSTGQALKSCSSANDYFEGPMITNAPGAVVYKSSFARCPDGYRVISGGWSTDGRAPTCPNSTNPNGFSIVVNRPSVAAGGVNGWQVTGTCISLKAVAVCQRGRN